MRICYLCPDRGISLDGHKGAAAHVRGLVRAFAELGHEVVVASPAPSAEPLAGATQVAIATPAIIDQIGLDTHKRVIRALRHVWNNVAVEQSLEALADSGPIDLVYERYSPFGVAGAIIARRRGLRHVLEVNAPLAWEGNSYRSQALGEAAQALEDIAFGAATQIVAVSRELRDLLVDQGVDSARIEVVCNGVDVDFFSPQGDSSRDGLGDGIVIGFVGSLKPWHGLEMLIEAFRALAESPRYHLLIVGDGPEAKTVSALAEELPGRVTVVGGICHRDVPGYLRAMDIAVAPYPPLERFYYSPLKVLEYMAAGRAIVASRIGQLQELVEDGVTGMLVPPGDATALASALARLADDRALRATLGAAASSAARAEHTWRERAERILDLAFVEAEM